MNREPENDSAVPEGRGPQPAGGDQPLGGGAWDLLEDQPRPPRHAPAPPPPEGRVPWSGVDVFAIIGIVVAVFLVVSVLLGTVVRVAASVDPNIDVNKVINSPVANSLMWLLQWIVTFGVAFTYMKVRGYHVTLKTLGFRGTRLMRAVGLVVLVLFVALVIQGIYVQYVVPQQQQVTSLFGTSVVSFIVALVIVAFLTPIVEETFFRGIIHQGLAQQFGFLPGALMSSTIFMLAHLSLTVFLPIFVLGFGFAVLMSRTKSLWPSITAHFLWNAMGVLAQFLLR